MVLWLTCRLFCGSFHGSGGVLLAGRLRIALAGALVGALVGAFRIAPATVSFVGVWSGCAYCGCAWSGCVVGVVWLHIAPDAKIIHLHPFSNCDKRENEKSKRNGK